MSKYLRIFVACAFFLTAFMAGRKLSAAEAEDLKRLIDAHKEG